MRDRLDDGRLVFRREADRERDFGAKTPQRRRAALARVRATVDADTVRRDAQFLAGRILAGACGYSLVQPVNELLPFWQRGQLSSLSFPQ